MERKITAEANTTLREYTHQKLGRDYSGLAGYYTPLREARLEYNGPEVLYIWGHAAIESSCCGISNWDYVLVTGYIVNWQGGRNRDGLPLTAVEPIEDTETRSKLTELITTRENISRISFW